MTLPLCLSSRTGGRDGGSYFLLRGRRAAAAVWPTLGSGRRGGTEVEGSAVPRSSAFTPGREGIGESFTEVRTAAGRSRGGAGAGRAGPGDTGGLGPGAFFLSTDAQTARQSPAPTAQVLGFPSPRVPFCPSCGSRAGISGPGSRGPGS